MAKFCSKCNRKIGFFEESTNGMCRSCYDIEQERIKRKKQEEEQKRLEEQRKKQEEEQQKLEEQRKKEEDEQKRLEEQRKKHEEEQKKLEEQRKRQEEEQKKLEQERKEKEIQNKCEYMKNEIIKYPAVMEIFYIISRDDFFESYNYKDTYSKAGIILGNVLIELMKYLPTNFTQKDIDSINKIEILMELAPKMNYMFKDDCKIGDLTELEKKLIEEKNDENYYIDEDDSVFNKFIARNYLYPTNDDIDGDAINNSIEQKHSTELECYIMVLDAMEEADRKYGTAERYNDLRDSSSQKMQLLKVELFFDYALVVLYNLNFCKNLELFEENKELITMYNNLDSAKSDINYITEKLYYIYDKLYPNLFSEKLDYTDFFNLIKLESIVNGTREQKLDDEFANLVSKDMDLETKQKLIVERIKEKDTYLTLIKQDCTLEDNQKIRIIVDEILDRITIIKDTITLNELLSILANVKQMSIEIYNYLDKLEAEKEKERLLNGDLSIEKEMQQQELEYSNVQNGYEFEEYVANLYKKLGYTIEEVTKKSGDQRSRYYCI